MAADKIEAVKKMTETMSKENPAEMDRFAGNKDHFDTLMNNSHQVKSTSFERIDAKAFTTDEVQSLDKPVFAEENVSAQKNGSATDQDQKRRQRQTDQVEEISATGSKGSTSTSHTSSSNSLMDEVSKMHHNMGSASPENIKSQAKNVISQIDQVKTQLSQVNTEIKPSYQTLLKNRLTHIDESLKIALNKAGVEYSPPPVASAGENKNAIHKFLGFLTNSQNQLENLNVAVDQFNVTGQITPANMLAIQMKMSYVQQQIELFTSLLNKALESTKTIMNVQV